MRHKNNEPIIRRFSPPRPKYRENVSFRSAIKKVTDNRVDTDPLYIDRSLFGRFELKRKNAKGYWDSVKLANVAPSGTSPRWIEMAGIYDNIIDESGYFGEGDRVWARHHKQDGLWHVVYFEKELESGSIESGDCIASITETRFIDEGKCVLFQKRSVDLFAEANCLFSEYGEWETVANLAGPCEESESGIEPGQCCTCSDSVVVGSRPELVPNFGFLQFPDSICEGVEYTFVVGEHVIDPMLFGRLQLNLGSACANVEIVSHNFAELQPGINGPTLHWRVVDHGQPPTTFTVVAKFTKCVNDCLSGGMDYNQSFEPPVFFSYAHNISYPARRC